MDTVGIAFDGMTLTPSTLRHIRTMFPALKLMFPEEVRILDYKKDTYGQFNKAPETILASLMKEQSA